uniref:Uncharacterized protein n=1 Tax=Fagus sylvatica TaxID=28930 RepID=A0A2N9FKE1_FAGSY
MKVYFDSLRTWWLPLRLHWYLLLMVAASLNLNEISRILHRSTTQTPRFIATSLQPPLIPVKPYLSCHVMLGKLQSPKSPKCSVYAGRHLPHCSEINYGSGPSKGGDTFTAMAVGSDRAHGGKDVHKATIASTSPTILGHSTTGPHGQDTTSEVSEGPVHTQPKPKFEWRPRSGPSAAPGVQVSSGKETNPSRRLENALIPHPSQSEPRVAIVAPLPRLETAPPSVCVDRGLKPEDPTPHGWCESGSEMEGDDDEDVSEVWEESMHSNEENEVVCWESEEEPLEVVPLAMETLKEFGLVLGASFEEFEEELTQLLQNIEGRRNQNLTKGEAWPKLLKSVGKGSRELKNLVCTVNYEAGSAKNRGQTTASSKSFQTLGADIICLQERKLNLISRGIVRSLWGLPYVDWLYCGSDGASGGVVVMWDTRVVEKIDETVGHFSISCKFHSVFNHHEWVFSGVYVPQTVRDRLLMWEELACLHSWWGSPWCIKGDFNVVRFPSERVGGQFFSPAMQGFSDFISSIGLVDPLLEGGRFTWSNGKEREAMSRLDRFLFSPDWEDKFPCIVQRKMPRLMSDHFPITLECCQFQKCRRHFRFENMWLRAEGFLDHVQQWWASYQFNVAEGRPLTATEKAQKEIIQIDLEKTLLLEEISWRQKSQATWLNEGDKNTKKIHAMANSNRRHNSISTLLIDGELSTNQQAISESITQFYTRLYTKDVGWRPKLDGLGFSAYLLKMLNVGDGGLVRFWHDLWCGDAPLKVAYPALFMISGDKDESVAALMQFGNGSLHWELNFVRNVQDWEMDSMNSFLKLIYPVSLEGRGEDTLCWQQNPEKGFTVKSYYSCLSHPFSLPFHWKGIWKPKVPPRVAFFMWTVALGKVLTADNLRKRKIVIISWCCMCKVDGESMDHLFMHCLVAKELWDTILSLFGVTWIMPQHVRELIEGRFIGLPRQRHSRIWTAVPHCLMWCLWRERNLRTFEGSETSIDELKLLFFRTLFEWMQSTNLFSLASFQDFLEFL